MPTTMLTQNTDVKKKRNSTSRNQKDKKSPPNQVFASSAVQCLRNPSALHSLLPHLVLAPFPFAVFIQVRRGFFTRWWHISTCPHSLWSH
ncbi:unnamed protein product [Periconia digitata]|uniref:Uncharacterized protein n=1 Tax=Periconia digitata TaxID=1303443 RepID=A0A9W4XNG9_9PLEO|nr:unnamed protein product [Periconia digitata]